MMRIIYTRPDGGVNVIDPAAEYLARFPTQAEGLASVIARDVPADGSNVEIIDEAALPDRNYRGAWKQTGNVVDVDMGKARTIHMDRIREKRNAELNRLDIEVQKTQDRGEDATALQTERQRLRDIPQTFDLTAAATPDELKVLWPSGLPK